MVKLPLQYKTIKNNSEGIYTEMSSRFLAFAYPSDNESEIIQYKNQLKKIHHKAVHIVYACRFGFDTVTEKSSDDGEPAGSSGLPILNYLRSNALSNIIIFVVRYYGGKKLGIPGLIRAYRTAAENAIAENNILVKEISNVYTIVVKADHINAILHAVNQAGAEVLTMEYGDSCNLRIRINRSAAESIDQLQIKYWQAAFTYVESI